MNQTERFETNYQFVELQRTFHTLPAEFSDNDSSEIIPGSFLAKPLGWDTLIREYRLIILSEAGSGKTVEVNNIASTLRGEGKPSFFLRLENIAADFEDAFEVGSHKIFMEWLASNDEGWLFLDSVDEARLRHPNDFELAIRKLGRIIGPSKDRTHIVITGRTSAWRPKTDLAYCTDKLPYAASTTSVPDHRDEDEEPDASTTTKAGRDKPGFMIVALDDLTPKQIEIFIKARGIQDSQDFLDAVERADAWSFTSRPQDLTELTEFWLDKGRIGTRLENMQNSIERRLAERDQGRADSRPLSAERARQGSRLLAAATTLAQNPTIRVPDGADNSKGLAVQSVLPDWDDKDQSTLLSRPIFDEAIYGTVRFHHRSVREYLTAEWFSELLKHETSRRTIEALFFRNQYGINIVTPALRSVLPWLVILDEKVMVRVHKIAPEIFFEGGDPSQLPKEVRCSVLRDVCQQISDHTTGRSMHEYEAVQRFAHPDLTEEVKSLIRQHKGNDDLVAFLLRIIWMGQLEGALPEVMEIALTSTAKRYVRMVALRAVSAIGSIADQETLRQSFMAEASKLKREWLAELVRGAKPTDETITWLFNCLIKTEDNEPYTHDHLTDALIEFVGRTEIELIPKLVTFFNKLLSLQPVIERRHCEISEKFKWLIAPASKAVEQLIMKQHPASVAPDSLSILHNISVVGIYRDYEFTEVKTDFSTLVPEWKELNRALFWFEIERERTVVEKTDGKRFTEYWQGSFFHSFWKFSQNDFDYLISELIRQSQVDDKLVALSLSFKLYTEANRPKTWLAKLKKVVAGNDELSKRLNLYLKPPAQSKQARNWKRQEMAWKKRTELRQRKEVKYHEDWKKYLNENLPKLKAEIRDKPDLISNSLYYLFEQARHKQHTTTRWTEYNWKSLIKGYGDEVAQFYRDGVVSFWRHHKPTLRSEGAPIDKTSNYIIVGLTGLEIEAFETEDWPNTLNATEVDLACRYASFELNGFPLWFPQLFEAHPEAVSDFFINEVQYELSVEETDKNTHYLIDDLSWSGQWSWNQLSPRIYDLLKEEPNNLSNLDKLLKILQGSTISNDLIEKLASEKCLTLGDHRHLVSWFAVWVGVAPSTAISALKTKISEIENKDSQTLFAMDFITHLMGGRRDGITHVREAFKTPEYLKSLYLLMHEHIRRTEDIDRFGKGVYSPELRDHAQDARSGLFNLLDQIPGKESFLALMEIARLHPDEASRPWMLLRAKTRAEQDGDIEPWSPAQVREFNNKFECTPKSHRELAELAIFSLLDLKDNLEHGDNSIAKILRSVEAETNMRNYIGKELRENAFGRYSISQEEELADAKRPDLRFIGTSFDGPVPVELKLADNWSGTQLFERLENQLCGDYLRDNRSNRGVFLLVNLGNKNHWNLPESGGRVDFSGLTSALQRHWQVISSKFPKIDEIRVIGINLTTRSS